MYKTIDELFEANNLPVLRDFDKKATMLVKNFDDTKWGGVSPFPAICMEKLDGVCTLAINVFGDCYMFSRTGKRLQNVKMLESILGSFDCLRNSVVCLELCNRELSLERISGIVKPDRKAAIELTDVDTWNNSTFMGVFDMITLNAFIAGVSDRSFESRLESLNETVFQNQIPVVVPAHTIVETEEELDALFEVVKSFDGEGVVLCQLNAPWVAGYKNHHKTKRVRGVDFDLEVIGLEEGKGKRANMVGKLIVRYANDKPLAVDGRFTDDIRKEWFVNPELIIGKIVHVHALQLGSRGSLRLAKVHEVRIDKTQGDY